MFYSEVILARKGPLGKIWLAAHFDKKLTKKQIFSTDISSSVESVLNPANPLALRVSGHLMLGIVRIYSRKMKYLVTDCADAMWKIDLAFRPKNVDIDPTIAQIIDDARHFGNVSIDNEFPELENTAFPQDLLSGYDYPRLDNGRFSDNSFGNDGGFNEYSINAESPLFTRKSGPTGSSSRRSVASEIEIMREHRASSFGGSGSQQQHHRTSLSSMGSARPFGLSLGGGMEDEVPAYADFPMGDYDAFDPFPAHGYGGGGSVSREASAGGGGGGQLLEFGDAHTQDMQQQQFDEPPPFEPDYYFNPAEDETKAGEAGDEMESGKPAGGRESLRVQRQQEKAAAAAQRLRQEEEEEADRSEGEEEALQDKSVAAAGAGANGQRRKKKKRVMIDDRVELPSRLIKQRRTDLAPILRQPQQQQQQQQQQQDNADFSYAATRAQRNHLLHSSPLGQLRLSSSSSSSLLPAGVRGMCAELQEVFGMSINAAPLPFPLKDGAVASPQPAVALGPASVSAGNKVLGRSPDESIELTRAPRDSELSVAGRTSLLHGYDGPLSASKSANASYMDGAGTDGGGGGYSYTNMDDGGFGFGDSTYYGGGPGDDMFLNTSQQDGDGDKQQQQLMDFGEEGAAEEEKAGDGARLSSSSRHQQQQQSRGASHKQLARNAVSDLVSNTFSKSAAELESRSSREASGGSRSGHSSSSGGGSRHTRTEQFMEILEDEFRVNKDSVVSFDNLSAGVSKRVAAACFLEVLQLKTWGRIQAVQQAPFEDILLCPSSAPASATTTMVGSM